MDFAQQVKGSVDIVQVVGGYVRLKKQGAERWIGLCPFHSEKTPSFNVNGSLQIFKCFGCGKGGDVFTFLMEHQGLSFFEALKQLADQHGIPMPQRREEGDERAKLRDAVLRMHAAAQELFRAQLAGPAGAAAREYVQRRGLSPEAVQEFGIGYAPGGNRLCALLRQKGFPEDQIVEARLANRSEERREIYDFFRDRLTFPITDAQGRVIGFGARALRDDQQPKYLNSSDSPVYTKRDVLFNLFRAKQPMRKNDRVVLTEGYTDVIGIASAGVGEAVASCGTALTSNQVRTLRRLADTLIVNFDSDEAGREAAEKSIALALAEGFQVRVLELPGGQDPDEYCRAHGGEAYRKQLDAAPPYYSWLAERARSKFDMSTAEGRVRAFEFLKPSINLLPDKIARAALAGELADRLGVDSGLILEEFRRAATERSGKALPNLPKHPLMPSEKLLLELFLDSAEARAELLEKTAELAQQQKTAGAAIFQALAAAQASDQAFEFSAFEGRLDPRDRDIVSHIVFDQDRRPVSVDEGRDAFSALTRQALERRLRAVRREISDAERAGDRRRTFELLSERQTLERSLREAEDSAKSGLR